MQQAVIIHSPGGGSANEESLEQARTLLGEAFDVQVLHVDDERGPAELAARAVNAGCRVLIASGGDGTVSAVGGELAQRGDCVLGILPRGTANSIAAWLEIPEDVEGACAVILRGQHRAIDTAKVNDTPMILMAAVGIHASAITQVDPEAKQLLGPLSYVVEELVQFMSDARFGVRIWADGHEEEGFVSAVTVANIARKATLLAQGPAILEDDDGMLAVTTVSTASIAEAISTTFHLAATAIAEQPAERHNIKHFKAKEVRIATAEPMRVMVDGDDVMETPITIVSLPRSLKVFTPSPSKRA